MQSDLFIILNQVHVFLKQSYDILDSKTNQML